MNANARIIGNTILVTIIGGVIWLFANYQPADIQNLIAAVATSTLMIVAAFAIRLWIVDSLTRRESNARGFEVKLTTGEPPVLQKDKQ